jgi:competence protein ComEC
MKRPFFIIAFLCVINFFSWQLLFYFKDDNLRVVFFDVGQGDAIFIRTPQKHHILIDGGPGNIVLEKLEKELPFFYNSIDLIILSHPHEDHVSGLIEVLERYNVKNIVCTGVLGESSISRRWNDLINERGYKEARLGQKISANNFYITTLYPTEGIRNKEVKDLNEVSVVNLFVFKDKYSFLFTGDIYAAQEKEVISFFENCGKDCNNLEIDVLKVAHHGSKTSTSQEFLKKIMPKVAVIMAGDNNRYGHPHKEIIERLEEFEIKTMRTDKDGNIVFNISF